MGSIESKSSSKTIESLTFAALVITESGMPLRSRTTWRFVPAFPLSVGFGPVFGPLFSRDGCRVQRGALPVYLVGFSETVKQNLQKALPYARLLPLLEAPPEQVMALPQPIFFGSISQGMPLLSTKMMPLRAARSSTRGLPPSGLGGSSGKSDSIISHSSLLTNSLAILPTYPDKTVLKGSLSPEERHRVYKLLGLKIIIQPTGVLEVSGTFGGTQDLSEYVPTSAS